MPTPNLQAMLASTTIIDPVLDVVLVEAVDHPLNLRTPLSRAHLTQLLPQLTHPHPQRPWLPLIQL